VVGASAAVGWNRSWQRREAQGVTLVKSGKEQAGAHLAEKQERSPAHCRQARVRRDGFAPSRRFHPKIGGSHFREGQGATLLAGLKGGYRSIEIPFMFAI
jgi:hypothetical protein